MLKFSFLYFPFPKGMAAFGDFFIHNSFRFAPFSLFSVFLSISIPNRFQTALFYGMILLFKKGFFKALLEYFLFPAA